MPRISPSLLHRANRISPNLATLLPACRDLRSARHELRWIREHTAARAEDDHRATEQRLAALCARRGRGEPLQYVLGSQPFGPLDVQCRRGVLIPRPETEAWVYSLAELLAGKWAERRGPEIKVVDMCTGSGCVALLLYALLHVHVKQQGAADAGGARVKVAGYDISARAVGLSRRNLRANVEKGLLPGEAGEDVMFAKGDVFSEEWAEHRQDALAQGDTGGGIDVLVSNPPYISVGGFAHDTGRSVRNFEPKVALVPTGRHAGITGECRPEDVFYRRLFEIARVMGPRVCLFEVGDLEQATSVAAMALELLGRDDIAVEIWRDWPDMRPEGDEAAEVRVGGLAVPVRGSGHGRSVLAYRKNVD